MDLTLAVGHSGTAHPQLHLAWHARVRARLHGTAKGSHRAVGRFAQRRNARSRSTLGQMCCVETGLGPVLDSGTVAGMGIHNSIRILWPCFTWQSTAQRCNVTRRSKRRSDPSSRHHSRRRGVPRAIALEPTRLCRMGKGVAGLSCLGHSWPGGRFPCMSLSAAMASWVNGRRVNHSPNKPQTGSGDGYWLYGRMCEGLGLWDESERVMRAASESYANEIAYLVLLVLPQRSGRRLGCGQARQRARRPIRQSTGTQHHDLRGCLPPAERQFPTGPGSIPHFASRENSFSGTFLSPRYRGPRVTHVVGSRQINAMLKVAMRTHRRHSRGSACQFRG